MGDRRDKLITLSRFDRQSCRPLSNDDRPDRMSVWTNVYAAADRSRTLTLQSNDVGVLIDGVPVRNNDRPGNDHTLADWIRQCRRTGLFDHGRALYEKGGLNLNYLNETEQIEAEDDYGLCVCRGAATETKTRRKRRNTED